MLMQRGRFLSLMAAGSGLLSIRPSVAQVFSIGRNYRAVKDLEAYHFANCLDQVFHFKHLDHLHSAYLALIDVQESCFHDRDSMSIGVHGFSALFWGPNDVVLPQGIFQIANETFGVTELFAVPIYRDADGMYVEIIINRLGAPRQRRQQPASLSIAR